MIFESLFEDLAAFIINFVLGFSRNFVDDYTVVGDLLDLSSVLVPISHFISNYINF